MSVHEAIAACPVLTDADKALIRAMCTRRFAYCLAADESAVDLTAVDPADGTVPLYLIQNSTLFAYDSTDSTTAHDGVTCLVTADNKRYKAETIAPPYSVLDKDTTAQPASPTVGQRYLIPTAATGTDWAGQDGKVGIYTAAGWRFATVPIGRFLYVEDETAFYHRNASGVWTAGMGGLVYSASTIPITAIIGAKASFIVKVENQTTNAPPASPVAPVAYIIGSAPTGAWAANAGKLAVCLVDGTFTIITPATGDEVYDKALNGKYKWTGTAWESAIGAVVGFSSVSNTASRTDSAHGSSYYAASSSALSTTPTLNNFYTFDNMQIAYTAKRTGAKLAFEYSCSLSGGTVNVECLAALFRDSESNALDWCRVRPLGINPRFEITALDTSSHIYTAVFLPFDPDAAPIFMTRRKFSVKEYA